MARVLLVDDDASQLEIRRMIFEHAGHEVRVASSPEEAVGCAASFLPEVAITDLRMPRVEDGIALVRRLAVSMRVMVLSGTGVDAASLVGAERIFTKPCRMADLLAAVDRR